MAASSLPRRLRAEFVGTGLLVTVAVGSAICRRAAVARRRRLTTAENSTAIAVGLAVLILLFGPVSGAHFNPVVSLADWLLGRRVGTGNAAGHAAAYLVARVSGGIAGALLANVMFDRRILELSANQRITPGHLLGEVVATAGLIAVIFALARAGRAALSAAAVGAYIGAAYWWTSSTSFANPAVTMGRVFSDSFAGIAPDSAPVLAAALAKNPHDRFPRAATSPGRLPNRRIVSARRRRLRRSHRRPPAGQRLLQTNHRQPPCRNQPRRRAVTAARTPHARQRSG